MATTLYFLAGLSFVIGGFVMYFRETHKTISYFSLGFILLGIQALFDGIDFPNELVELVFKLPLLLASILFLLGIMGYLREGKKSEKKRRKKK